VGKIVYLLARYLALVDVSLFFYYITAQRISERTCHSIFAFIDWGGSVVIAAAEAILIMRTSALAGHNKWLVVPLLVLFAGVTIFSFVIVSIILRTITYGKSPVPTFRACYPIKGAVIGYIPFVLILFLETLIMVITLVIWIRKFRYTHSQLVVSLFSDGIIFYIYIFCISFINIIIQPFGPIEMVESLIILQIVMHSLLSCRVLLHVRRDASPNYFEQEYELDNVSALHFRTLVSPGL